MNIFNQIEESKKIIQTSNIYGVKEVAEYELNKLLSSVEELAYQEEKESDKSNDYYFLTGLAYFGLGVS